LNSNGAGQVTLKVTALAAGTNTYGLWVDGTQMDSRKKE
jgi:hypothetical protein